MGKTTLLDYAVASAAGMNLARVAGIQAEGEFGFGALQPLLIPFMDHVAALPDRQRDAIGTAFGVRDGPAPDRFVVGLAALTMLADAAAERPLLCVVDDAQRLDHESLDALALIGRRLFAEGVALLFGVRVSPSAPTIEGLPVLEIGGLSHDSALQLLDSVVTGPLVAEVARRIVVETGGCPLALSELALGLRPEQLAGDEPLPEPLPISGQLEQHFLFQARNLPPDTQTALLIVAAEPSADPTVVWRASKNLGIDPTALDIAQAEGLLTTTPEIGFRHPLIRSAVYSAASASDRRTIHQALADATDPARPDARAWHLAEVRLPGLMRQSPTCW
jgi:hypothetical protein